MTGIPGTDRKEIMMSTNCIHCVVHDRTGGDLLCDPCHVIAELLNACEGARNLYDHMALGSLEAAAKYGPDYEPPTDEDCLQVRGALESAITNAKRRR